MALFIPSKATTLSVRTEAARFTTLQDAVHIVVEVVEDLKVSLSGRNRSNYRFVSSDKSVKPMALT